MKLNILNAQSLFDFDQAFTPTEDQFVVAYVEIASNNDQEARIDAQLADVDQDNWTTVGYLYIHSTSGHTQKSGISFFCPLGKRWRVHNASDPLSINSCDFARVF